MTTYEFALNVLDLVDKESLRMAQEYSKTRNRYDDGRHEALEDIYYKIKQLAEDELGFPIEWP